uniref:Glutaredoxin domain-containing protein n=1 Tax=Strongyloides stercoralis TaxID=6248 RepID=A0A0K0EL95_STRER
MKFQLQKLKWIFQIPNISIFFIADTIFYLRIYHVIVGFLMIAASIVMVEFMIRTRKLPKLDSPHEMPRPAMIGAITLTIGIVVGYSYFIIFNFSFSNCDKLVDQLYGSEFYLDAIYSSIMIIFSLLSLIYVFHRSYYGAINTHLDNIGRLWINITFTIVWFKIVIYKGYLSHQELCQRKELEGYWCPVIKRHYDCDPYNDLDGTQKIWFYINKGLLNTSVISCASEFFPVLLISHWLACGGAEEKAEDLLRKKQLKKNLRGLMQDFFKDISRVYAEISNVAGPPLIISNLLKYQNILFALTACIGMLVKWFVSFYYSIKFDILAKEHWIQNDWIFLVASIIQAIFFLSIYRWVKTIKSDRLDAHHKAQARGDIIILFGCSVILSVKFILQSVELFYQQNSNIISVTEEIIKTLSLFFIQVCLWFQYLTIRRLLALSDRDLNTCKSFLPTVAISGFFLAWIHFGCTYLDTFIIKYQLTDETFNFNEISLICMIFTQTIFPADYLYAFTVSGCWMDLIIRYMEMGLFQLGTPRLEISEHHGNNQLKKKVDNNKILNDCSVNDNYSITNIIDSSKNDYASITSRFSSK